MVTFFKHFNRLKSRAIKTRASMTATVSAGALRDDAGATDKNAVEKELCNCCEEQPGQRKHRPGDERIVVEELHTSGY